MTNPLIIYYFAGLKVVRFKHIKSQNTEIIL